jgi:hypothetical protein
LTKQPTKDIGAAKCGTSETGGVGALLEEVDIKDQVDSIAETKASDVLRLWQQLLRGSQNHLNAFTSQLAAQGVDNEPIVLDTTTYGDMLSEVSQGNGAQGSSTGHARGHQGGRGHGRNG